MDPVAGLARDLRQLIAAPLDDYRSALDELDVDSVAAIAQLIVDVHAADGSIFICGNGGSAATASHLACDLVKTADRPGARPIRAMALGDNQALLTAWANDASFDRVFAEPLRAYGRPGDLLVAISVSGRSPNVVAAAREAARLGMRVAAMTGRDGGELGTLADVKLNVASSDFGRVESMHTVAHHLIAVGVQEYLRIG